MKMFWFVLIALVIAGCGSKEVQKDERIDIKREVVTDIGLKSDELLIEDIVLEGITHLNSNTDNELVVNSSNDTNKTPPAIWLMPPVTSNGAKGGLYKITIHRERKKTVDSVSSTREYDELAKREQELKKVDVNNASAAGGTSKVWKWVVLVVIVLINLMALAMWRKKKA